MPIAIVVDVAVSWNSVKLPVQPENAASVPVLVWYAMQIAMRRSPLFLVSDDRDGNVRVAVVLAWTFDNRRPLPDVGIVGKAIRLPLP
jgi:hypothetical protein